MLVKFLQLIIFSVVEFGEKMAFSEHMNGAGITE